MIITKVTKYCSQYLNIEIDSWGRVEEFNGNNLHWIQLYVTNRKGDRFNIYVKLDPSTAIIKRWDFSACFNSVQPPETMSISINGRPDSAPQKYLQHLVRRVLNGKEKVPRGKSRNPKASRVPAKKNGAGGGESKPKRK